MATEKGHTLVMKSIAILVLGSFSYPDVSTFGAICILPIALILANSLIKGDIFSFLLQIFIGCHFTYGKQIGGIYTLAGSLAIIIFVFIGRDLQRKNRIKSSLSSVQKNVLYSLLFLQIVSLTANSPYDDYKKIISILFFFSVVTIFIFGSRLNITEKDCKRFINIIFFTSVYMLLVALNQIYQLIPENPLMPTYENGLFEKNIFRSSGTLLNFEFFGEYSLGIILLLLPGTISGSFKRLGNFTHKASIATIVISCYSIILSGTRSSLLLLPIFFIVILFKYNSYIKYYKLAFISILLIIPITLIDFNSFIDLDSFSNRNENLKGISLDKVLSGEAINRGATFTYGIQKIGTKIQNGSLIIGEGYYTTRDEYKKTHFDKLEIIFPDYHNFYMSSIILWGLPGALLFIYFFASFVFKGIQASNSYKSNNIYGDLIFGYNLLFVSILINQFKIQFIRDSNYFTLLFVLLIIYSNLSRATGLYKSKKIVSHESNVVY